MSGAGDKKGDGEGKEETLAYLFLYLPSSFLSPLLPLLLRLLYLRFLFLLFLLLLLLLLPLPLPLPQFLPLLQPPQTSVCFSYLFLSPPPSLPRSAFTLPLTPPPPLLFLLLSPFPSPQEGRIRVGKGRGRRGEGRSRSAPR